MTKQQLKNEKADIEQWLLDNHSEHEFRPYKEAELKEVNNKLAQIEGYRTFERDTFDLRNHDFNL